MSQTQPGGGLQYRVSGFFGGEWQSTEYVDTLEEAEEMFREIRQGDWSQLSIERSDGVRKANPESEWFGDSGGSSVST